MRSTTPATAATTRRRRGARAYAARLADGAFDDARADADGARVDREREAWLDVLRCLDTWAQRASASGVSSLGDVDDAIHQDGVPSTSTRRRLAAGK
ncbi:hypothetical protein JL720_12762 [Aureococcus anophagefferens]|nr:hypothetical protein JL720_12762 [Aureococcus anophagefferens]